MWALMGAEHIEIEIIGLEPPPASGAPPLLENVREAVKLLGIDAIVAKHWTLAQETRDKYGLLMTSALVIDRMVAFQGKVFRSKSLLVC